MLTTKQIKERAEIVCIEGHLLTEYERHIYQGGATWANEHAAAQIEKIDKLCAEGAALVEKLQAENEALEKDVFRLKMRVEQLEKAYKEACKMI